MTLTSDMISHKQNSKQRLYSNSTKYIDQTREQVEAFFKSHSTKPRFLHVRKIFTNSPLFST